MRDSSLALSRGLPSVRSESPRAAYVHVPFCAHHCGYCNFTVVAGRSDLIEAYLTALEIELRALEYPRPVDTLYFGGGTPTHLSPRVLERLARLVMYWFPPAEGAEITVEANPRDVDGPCAAVLASAGVNRVSLGAQSFQPDKLRVLERDHGGKDVERAAGLVREFADVSLDLIFGVPGESLENWLLDLRHAVALSPEHLSVYGLTFEKGARFWGRLHRGELMQAPEELELAMYEGAIDYLQASGYEHYEVSNFARPTFRCRHNEVYWAGEEYYGAGAGAARYVGRWREVNHRSTTTYIRRLMRGESPVVQRERLANEDRAREALVLGLRRRRGVERTDFQRRFRFRIDDLLGPDRAMLVDQGLMEEEGESVRLTRRGLMVSDSIWPRILRR